MFIVVYNSGAQTFFECDPFSRKKIFRDPTKTMYIFCHWYTGMQHADIM